MIGAVVVALVGVLGAAGGCAWTGYAGELETQPYTDRIVFSRDGMRAAYVWTDRCSSLIPLGFVPLAEAKSEFVGWSGPHGRSDSLTLIDAKCTLGGFGNLRSINGLEFSPDGAHLAAVLEDRIEIIDVRSGKRRRVSPQRGKIASMRWFSSNCIVYATDTAVSADGLHKARKSIFREEITTPAHRVQLFSKWSKRSRHEAHKEFWSPDGGAALIIEAPNVRLLDLGSGQLTRVARLANCEIDEVAWKPAGSAALCLFTDRKYDTSGGYSTSGKLLKAILVDRTTREVTDLTAAFRRVAGETYVGIISWTRDGQYVLTRGYPTSDQQTRDHKIYLIRPRPWQVIPFRDNYGKALPRNYVGFPVVQTLRPGWLAVGPGKKDPMMYAVDYQGRRVIPVTKYPFAISPDGMRIAEVIRNGKVTIRELKLPDLGESRRTRRAPAAEALKSRRGG